jgi:hypothetical protein
MVAESQAMKPMLNETFGSGAFQPTPFSFMELS